MHEYIWLAAGEDLSISGKDNDDEDNDDKGDGDDGDDEEEDDDEDEDAVDNDKEYSQAPSIHIKAHILLQQPSSYHYEHSEMGPQRGLNPHSHS